ncbi:hypothetical protein ACLBR5_07910 [Escherichia coli]
MPGNGCIKPDWPGRRSIFFGHYSPDADDFAAFAHIAGKNPAVQAAESGIARRSAGSMLTTGNILITHRCVIRLPAAINRLRR